MSASALGPAGAAVFDALMADVTLAAALVGAVGVCGEIPQDPTLPVLWIELFNERDLRGFGMGGVPEIELRTHTYTARGGATGGVAQAREINRLTVAALKDQWLTVSGYAQIGRVTYAETIPFSDETLAGVMVHEIVSRFYILAEET